jgi:cellobiose phosphorylase
MEACIPPDWPGYEITYRYGSATYNVAVKNGDSGSLILDGRALSAAEIDLTDDGQQHEVHITIPPSRREQWGQAAD